MLYTYYVVRCEFVRQHAQASAENWRERAICSRCVGFYDGRLDIIICSAQTHPRFYFISIFTVVFSFSRAWLTIPSDSIERCTHTYTLTHSRHLAGSFLFAEPYIRSPCVHCTQTFSCRSTPPIFHFHHFQAIASVATHCKCRFAAVVGAISHPLSAMRFFVCKTAFH